ncbi:MAG: hypothetical protein E6J91_17375 [Deltaproteobacteria bacterium]|nr:MAG: hypothetical protein E6J91_17375 [Deltaproteobacteria bacterium]
MRTSEAIARHAWCAGVLIAALIGCASDPSPTLSAQQLFATRAWPALGRCAGCHATQPTIAFLAPGTPTEAYATMFAFQPPIVDVASPASSLVLTMGQHTGPALLPGDADAILAWLDAEHAERVPDPGMAVTFGPIDLALDMVNVALHVVHPLFASLPSLGPPRIDTSDAFRDIDLDLAAGAAVALGGGAAVLPGFDPGDPITIHFRTLEAP